MHDFLRFRLLYYKIWCDLLQEPETSYRARASIVVNSLSTFVQSSWFPWRDRTASNDFPHALYEASVGVAYLNHDPPAVSRTVKPDASLTIDYTSEPRSLSLRQLPDALSIDIASSISRKRIDQSRCWFSSLDERATSVTRGTRPFPSFIAR